MDQLVISRIPYVLNLSPGLMKGLPNSRMMRTNAQYRRNVNNLSEKIKTSGPEGYPLKGATTSTFTPTTIRPMMVMAPRLMPSKLLVSFPTLTMSMFTRTILTSTMTGKIPRMTSTRNSTHKPLGWRESNPMKDLRTP